MKARFNTLHYCTLHLIYQDDTSSFKELLLKGDNSSQILEYLAVEMFKVKTGERTFQHK